ncbi:hypothetical protein T439DRAFT_228433 [Meredithblackwellia eburnea MCA 4105]
MILWMDDDDGDGDSRSDDSGDSYSGRAYKKRNWMNCPTVPLLTFIGMLRNLTQLSLIGISSPLGEETLPREAKDVLRNLSHLYVHHLQDHSFFLALLGKCRNLRSLMVVGVNGCELAEVLEEAPSTLQHLTWTDTGNRRFKWYEEPKLAQDELTTLDTFELCHRLPNLVSLQFGAGSEPFQSNRYVVKNKPCNLPPIEFSAQLKHTKLRHLAVAGVPDEILLGHLPPSLQTLAIGALQDDGSSLSSRCLPFYDIDVLLPILDKAVAWKVDYDLYSLREITVSSLVHPSYLKIMGPNEFEEMGRIRKLMKKQGVVLKAGLDHVVQRGAWMEWRSAVEFWAR